jgi:hypothetical protein
MEFELAPTVRIDQFKTEVRRILVAAGHEEALVTDWSTISDLVDDEPDDYRRLSDALGVRVEAHSKIADIAEALSSQTRDATNTEVRTATKRMMVKHRKSLERLASVPKRSPR